MAKWLVQTRSKETRTVRLFSGGTRTLRVWTKWKTVQTFTNVVDARIVEALNNRVRFNEQTRVTFKGAVL